MPEKEPLELFKESQQQALSRWKDLRDMADKNLAELMRSAQQMYDKDIAKAEKFFEEALATASKI